MYVDNLLLLFEKHVKFSECVILLACCMLTPLEANNQINRLGSMKDGSEATIPFGEIRLSLVVEMNI